MQVKLVVENNHTPRRRTLLVAAAMSALARSSADLVAGLVSRRFTASVGGLRMRSSRFNILQQPAESDNLHGMAIGFAVETRQTGNATSRRARTGPRVSKR